MCLKKSTLNLGNRLTSEKFYIYTKHEEILIKHQMETSGIMKGVPKDLDKKKMRKDIEGEQPVLEV